MHFIVSSTFRSVLLMLLQVMECSAKTNTNVREIFKTFLTLTKIPVPSQDDCGLRRRSSAHASSLSCSQSKGNSRCTTPNTLSPLGFGFENHLGNHEEEEGGTGSTNSVPTAVATTTISSHITNSMNAASRLKPRSRSLIRRTSKKVNKVKDPNSDPEDCILS